MKVLLIARATLYKEPGGDTIQVINTANYLRNLGVEADVKLTHEVNDYHSYNLLHFFNIIRPADILVHIRRSKKPFVVSPIFIDYAEYDKLFRKGLAGSIFKIFSSNSIEYLKIIARSIFNGEKIMSKEYLWLGQKKSVQQILAKASFLLPNSYNEYNRLKKHFILDTAFHVVTNGIDATIFDSAPLIGQKDKSLVICVARIEGRKNQLNLIKALNGTRFKLLLIGKPGLNQQSYLKACKACAADNIHFMGRISEEELIQYYKQAKVHVLPSWFETTGLSSLEAAAMGCNIVVTDRGDTEEYFGTDACYCDPASPQSIYNAVEKAASDEFNSALRSKIYSDYTWNIAASQTLEAYTALLKHHK